MQFKFAIVIAVAAIVSLSLALAASSVGSGNKTASSNTPSLNPSRLQIVTSFYPMYEFTRAIAGDKGNVTTFVPIGDEPHDWEPTPQEIQNVQAANLFIYNGYGVESFIPSIANNTETFPHTTFVMASEGITTIAADVNNLPSNESKPTIAQGGRDPHVWNDPVLAQKEVRNIANAMEKADPANAEYYESNAVAYNLVLAKLDHDIGSNLSSCDTRTFVSFHNAFGYFTKRYNLTDYWLSGLAPDAEILPQDISRVEGAIKQSNVTIIFSEDLVDPNLANTLASDAGASVKILSPLEGVTPTELQKHVSFTDKWYENLDNLKIALKCK